MPKIPDESGGPLAVGLYALHDRKFFAALLKDPASALTELTRSGKISLTDRDREVVIRLIEEASRAEWEPLEEWDKYNRTGFWGNGWLSAAAWPEVTESRPPGR